MMYSDLIERVAESMWQAEALRTIGHKRTVRWADEHDDEQRQWRNRADDALTALREVRADVANAILTLTGARDE